MGTKKVDEVFADNFRSLLRENKIPQEKFAKIINKSREAVTGWLNSGKKPDFGVLVDIADEFGVSVDWLLGRTTTRSPEIDIRNACETTGLSERTVKTLHSFNNRRVSALNIDKDDPTIREFDMDVGGEKIKINAAGTHDISNMPEAALVGAELVCPSAWLDILNSINYRSNKAWEFALAFHDIKQWSDKYNKACKIINSKGEEEKEDAEKMKLAAYRNKEVAKFIMQNILIEFLNNIEIENE